MYILNFLSNFIEKSLKRRLKMLSNSLPDADLNLPEMKIKSPSYPSGGVHMYALLYISWNMYKIGPCITCYTTFWSYIQHSLE